MGTRALVACVAAGALTVGIAACGGDDSGGAASSGGNGVKVGLITKTETNPFFVKMKEGASAAADKAGADLQSFAGKKDGDNESQVAAVGEPVSGRAQGLIVQPDDP